MLPSLVIAAIIHFGLNGVAARCSNGGFGDATLRFQRENVFLLGTYFNRYSQLVFATSKFTCNGSLTAWLFAGKVGSGVQLPELQIWRPTTAERTEYVFVSATRKVAIGQSAYQDVYIQTNVSLDFQAGDTIGILQPPPQNSSYYIAYVEAADFVIYRAESQTVSLRYLSLTQSGLFTKQSSQPLIAIQTSNPSCTGSFLNIGALTEKLGPATNFISFRGKGLSLYPTLSFTCAGIITRWTYMAEVRGGQGQTEFQVWRSTATPTTFVKVGQSIATGELRNETSHLYHIFPTTQLHVEVGDVLGIYQEEDSFLALGHIHQQSIAYRVNVSQSQALTVVSLPRLLSEGTNGTEAAVPLINVDVTVDCGATDAHECGAGYKLTAASSTPTCPPNETRNGTSPNCTNFSCSKLAPPTNGAVSIMTRGKVELADYGCNAGFQLIGNLTRLCLKGAWSDSQPRCQAMSSTCANPPTVPGSMAWVWLDSDGSPVATYACLPGSWMNGSDSLQCQRGTWQGKLPDCVYDCGYLSTQKLDGGFIMVEKTTTETKMHYSCAVGYRMVGNSVQTCQENGTWSGEPPICVPSLRNDTMVPAPFSTPIESLHATAVSTVLENRSSNANDGLFLEGSLSLKVLVTAVTTGFLGVTTFVVIAIALIYVKRVMGKCKSISERSLLHRNSESLINNPTYEVHVSPPEYMPHYLHSKRHRVTHSSSVVSPFPHTAALVSMDYEMQSMKLSTGTASHSPSTLYIEAASIEMPLGEGQTNTGTGTLYGALMWSIYVPTQEQRKQLTTSALCASYEFDELEEQHRTFFEEAEKYWRPAFDTISLYGQLAKKKYREILRHQIQIKSRIGGGQFGMVHRGLWQASRDVVLDVAVKMIRPDASEEDAVKFLQEAAINGQFHHPNVVELFGVVTVGTPVMIVLELMSNGDLKSYLNKKRSSVNVNWPPLLLKFCTDVAQGMEYLSRKSYVHRDLAARNILVSENFVCKISDFGLSRDLADDNFYISHGGKVPIKWTAPEALHYKKYSTASDVWSFGCIMFEIWSLGHKPFESLSNQETVVCIDQGARLAPPPGCPRVIYEIMMSCWHPCSDCRPSFNELVCQFSRPADYLLRWTKEDTLVNPLCTVVGAPLEASDQLCKKGTEETQVINFMPQLSRSSEQETLNIVTELRNLWECTWDENFGEEA